MAAKFILKKSGDEFMFNLQAGNGQVILTSERYKAKASATNGIDSVKKNADDDARYERRESKSGKPYFVLKAANHEIIGTSQMYADAGSMEEGIASAKHCGPGADTDDQTS